MNNTSIAKTVHANWLSSPAANEVGPPIADLRRFFRDQDLDYVREQQPTAFMCIFNFADGSVIRAHTYYDPKDFSNQKRIMFTEAFNDVADFNKAIFNVTNGVAISKSPLA